MAKVKEVTVEVSYTKNLGNYENIKPAASITLIPEEGETFQDVYKRAWTIVSEQILEQLEEFSEARKKRGL